jgi:hypothetical protein
VSQEQTRGLTGPEQRELIKRRFSLLNYLLRSPLYDQRSKVRSSLENSCQSIKPSRDEISSVESLIKPQSRILGVLSAEFVYFQLSTIGTSRNHYFF